MFEVGFSEILLIFGIALLVLGPERLPKLAADVGRWAGRARAMARQLRSQLEQEVQFDPLAETGNSARSGATHSIQPPAATHSIQPPPAPGATPSASTGNTVPAAVHGDAAAHVESLPQEGVSAAAPLATPDVSHARTISSDEPKPG